jgi:hypothetical protein
MRVATVQRRRGEEPRLGDVFSRDVYAFMPGDVVFCKAGEEADGTPSRDAWWPALVREPFHVTKQRPRCILKFFWLDRVPHLEKGWRLNSAGVSAPYHVVLQGEGNRPLCIPVEEVTAGWEDGAKMYEFSPEICDLADGLAEKHDGRGTSASHGDSGSDSESEGSSEGEEVQRESIETRREAAREVARTVMSTTASGREARHDRVYKDYRQMHTGATRPRQPRTRTIGHEGYYNTCGGCGHAGDMLMCDGQECIEAYHVGCVGLTVAPAGDWHCPTCEV